MGNAIERHVTFHVIAAEVEAFEKFFIQDYRPAMATIAGFIKAELLKDSENPQDLQMVLRFESSQAAADWRASEVHAALKPRLKSMYNGSELQIYEVLA
ncbi:MAG: antibiotic biosynthesis monooxygenase [Chloroflexota bacterium]|nr:MAG: antibiotic biosynthesis monooxygenase [Chloroflexota bacterium]